MAMESVFKRAPEFLSYGMENFAHNVNVFLNQFLPIAITLKVFYVWDKFALAKSVRLPRLVRLANLVS